VRGDELLQLQDSFGTRYFEESDRTGGGRRVENVIKNRPYQQHAEGVEQSDPCHQKHRGAHLPPVRQHVMEQSPKLLHAPRNPPHPDLVRKECKASFYSESRIARDGGRVLAHLSANTFRVS